MIISPIGLGYKIFAALFFGCGLLAICEEQLNLVTGKFGLLYDGSWNLRQILIIFISNILGVITIFLIRYFDAMPELVYEVANPIIIGRDAKMWYQHIFSGIGCGICIQIAVSNWKTKGEPWGVILPVGLFILCGFEHCIADSFYYCWSSFSWQHIIQIFEVFIGNLIGAFIVLLPNQGKLPHCHF